MIIFWIELNISLSIAEKDIWWIAFDLNVIVVLRGQCLNFFPLQTISDSNLKNERGFWLTTLNKETKHNSFSFNFLNASYPWLFVKYITYDNKYNITYIIYSITIHTFLKHLSVPNVTFIRYIWFLNKNAITFDGVQWDFFNEVITGNGMVLLKWNFMFVGSYKSFQTSCNPFVKKPW